MPYAHLGSIYQTVVQDIAFFKRQQWVATNYVILVYVVVIALEGRFGGQGWDFSLWAISVAAWVTGHWLLCTVHESIQKGRNRLWQLKKLLPPRVKKIMEKTQQIPDNEKKNPLTWVFMVAQDTGVALVTVILFPPPGPVVL